MEKIPEEKVAQLIDELTHSTLDAMIEKVGPTKLYENIPDDWEYSDVEFGANPDKESFVYAYWYGVLSERIYKTLMSLGIIDRTEHAVEKIEGGTKNGPE